MSDDRDPYASNQGCSMPPGMIPAILFAVVWWVGLTMYQQWRYRNQQPGPETVETSQGDDGGATGAAKAGDTERNDAKAAPGAETTGDLVENVSEGVGMPGMGTANAVAAEAADLAAAVEATDPALPEETYTVATDQFELEFTSRGAGVMRAHLVGYHYTPEAEGALDILAPLAPPDEPGASFYLRAPDLDGETRNPLAGISTAVWELDRADEDYDANGEMRVAFRLVRAGVELRKTFVLREGVLTFDVDLEVRNTTRKRIEQIRIDLVGPNGIVPDEESLKSSRSQVLAMIAGRDDPQGPVEATEIGYKTAGSEDPTDRKISKSGRGSNEWAAVRNRFFTVIMQSLKPETVRNLVAEAVDTTKRDGATARYTQENIRVASGLRFDDLDPTDTARSTFSVYIGPLHQPVLEAAKTARGTGASLGWYELVDYGWFASLSKLLLWLLRGFHYLTAPLGSIIGGYGLAIFLLTMAVKGAMHPLQRKAMVSMQKMQKLQPEMKAIRKKYEKDKSMEAQRRMQKEIMELYQKNNASMTGGCGPMLIQMPMFFAFYGMLRGAFELRQQSFLWIADLSQPDVLFTHGLPIPWLGASFRLLPVLYTAMSFVHMRMQPKSADPQAQQTQKMMQFMPVMFFFFFWGMPSALVLYFVFSNAFMLVESWYIRKYIIPASNAAGPAAATAAASDAPPPPTSWDKQDAKQAKKAEKKKKRDAGGAPPPRFR